MKAAGAAAVAEDRDRPHGVRGWKKQYDMRERCEYLAGTLDDRRRDEVRMCGTETEYAAAVVTEDLLEGKHHRLLTVSISLQESASQFDGSEALHAPSGLEVVALGDVVSVHVGGGESLSQKVADCALASARGAD